MQRVLGMGDASAAARHAREALVPGGLRASDDAGGADLESGSAEKDEAVHIQPISQLEGGTCGEDGADEEEVLDLQEGVERTPLPRMQLFVLCVVLLCDNMGVYQLFPIVPNMVVDFGLVDTTDQAGYYAGTIASTFSIAQFLSSYFWGRASDRVGRRPIILMGTVTTCVATIVFGLSQWFWMAVSARAIHGLFNGYVALCKYHVRRINMMSNRNIGVVKTYLGEVTDPSNRAKAFSYFAMVGGIGRIVGPSLGGFLSRPAVQYPAYFSEDGLFGRFPYLLPSLVTASIISVGTVLGWFFLTESKKDLKHDDGIIEVELEEVAGKPTVVDGAQHIEKDMGRLLDDSGSSDDPDGEEVDAKSFASKAAEEEEEEEELVEAPEPLEVVPWYRTRGAVLCGLLYGLLAFQYIMFDEVMSLLSVASHENGGLEFQERHIGLVQSLGGSVILLFQLFLYPKLANRFGALTLFRVAACGSIGLFFVFPNVSYLFDTWMLWPGLITLAITRYVFSLCAFTSVFVLIANSAPAPQLGAVNGYGQSLASAARGTGPLLVSVLFAWSLSGHHSFPFEFHFVYVLLTVIATVTFSASLLLPASVDRQTQS